MRSFEIRIFLKPRRLPPYEIFCFCETKQFRRKIVIPPSLISNIFRYQKYSERQHRRVLLRNVSVVWDKTLPMENRDTLPLLCNKVLDTRIFLKHRRVHLLSFSLLWDKRFPTENRDIPKGAPKSLFGTVRQKVLRKIVIPPLLHKV